MGHNQAAYDKLAGIESGATADQTAGEIVALLEAQGAGDRLSHLYLDDSDANTHHTQLHTIASHTGTTGTGAELTELTDGSDTSLHLHDGRYYRETELDAMFADGTIKHDALGNQLVDSHSQYLRTDGLRKLTGAFNLNSQELSNANIVSGTINNITDLNVVDGGTGASSGAGARTNLGLVIGTDIQAHHGTLDALVANTIDGVVIGGTTRAGGYFTGVGAGTSSPAELIHAYAATGASRIEVETGDGSSAIFKMTNTAGSYGWYADGAADKIGLYNFGTSATILTIGPVGGIDVGGQGDTNLYRSAANVLKTDDTFQAATLTDGTISITGGDITGVDDLTANDIFVNSEIVHVNDADTKIDIGTNYWQIEAGGDVMFTCGSSSPKAVFDGIGFFGEVQTQQAHIADAATAAGDPPTQAEFDALVGKFNTLLADLEGYGLLAAA